MTVTYEEEVLARMNLVRKIRARTRDYADLNTLIEGEEHSDRLIGDVIEDILSDFNATPPPVGVFLVANFPNPLALIWASISELLRSVHLLYARNDLVYSQGGTTVQYSQVQTYPQIANDLWGRYEQAKYRLKVSIGMQQAVNSAGGNFSTWSAINRPVWQTFSTDLSQELYP